MFSLLFRKGKSELSSSYDGLQSSAIKSREWQAYILRRYYLNIFTLFWCVAEFILHSQWLLDALLCYFCNLLLFLIHYNWNYLKFNNFAINQCWNMTVRENLSGKLHRFYQRRRHCCRKYFESLRKKICWMSRECTWGKVNKNLNKDIFL